MKLPKLHLRDLFWLIALVAMGCAWLVDRRKLVDGFSSELQGLQTDLFFAQQSLEGWSRNAAAAQEMFAGDGIEFEITDNSASAVMPARNDYQRPVVKKLVKAGDKTGNP